MFCLKLNKYESFSSSWNCESRERDTYSSESKFELDKLVLVGKGLAGNDNPIILYVVLTIYCIIIRTLINLSYALISRSPTMVFMKFFALHEHDGWA